MDEETKTTKTAKTAKERKREVLTRFTPSELEAMKAETGAEADAAAVASFARKNLRRRAQP